MDYPCRTRGASLSLDFNPAYQYRLLVGLLASTANTKQIHSKSFKIRNSDQMLCTYVHIFERFWTISAILSNFLSTLGTALQLAGEPKQNTHLKCRRLRVDIFVWARRRVGSHLKLISTPRLPIINPRLPIINLKLILTPRLPIN